MNIEVRYFTRSRHTQKLANAIADAIGTAAHDLSAPLTDKAYILFLGCSYYAFDMDAEVKAFITSNKDKIGKIVLFGTSAMMKSMKKPMKKVTDPLGIALAEEEFHCKGEFKVFNKNRPDENDLKAAAEFAKAVAQK